MTSVYCVLAQPTTCQCMLAGKGVSLPHRQQQAHAQDNNVRCDGKQQLDRLHDGNAPVLQMGGAKLPMRSASIHACGFHHTT